MRVFFANCDFIIGNGGKLYGALWAFSIIAGTLFLIYFNAKSCWGSHKPYSRMLIYLLLSLHVQITTSCFFGGWTQLGKKGMDKFPWFPKQ